MTTNICAASMQHTLADEGVAVLLLTDTINIRYFSGIHFKHPGSAAMLLFADRPPVVYSGELEYETALTETRVEDIRTYGWQEEYESVLIRALREAGAEDRAFETIFSSGSRTAMCHGFASEKRLEPGDLVMFDLGAVHQGYHSDMTRMATVGEPKNEHRDAFGDLKKVYDVLIGETLPGISVGELLRRGSEAVEESEYAEAFICGYGRGLGLTLIEEPTLSMDSELTLEPGMIITFHPQFYFLHRFGLRLESTVFVTENGAEVLTPLPMELYRI